ncbi:Rhodanese-like/PpiC domain-containing protein 12, chloroplastic [Gracilariopsis chorda]|uniref:Peptidyl-prolyl cis-trans isomerase n=1 Tax=Gracilariopsis chorda TaxID=448386 RepID=A0A2V3IYG3_9FLOR|nr:Rhodanese-like/PpiC domain-containing protein 12, chloroplastic [Gracilariopsis chorda]|eukprot:PXF47192.1 Rhodanese-like/PpiC domain-containing protein 12, chloroplastic [Gracilariopsis chorda]
MVRAKHILVDSEEMIDAIKQQLEDGKGNFADLAKLVSTCPSKDRGGDLGWFKRNIMVKEFEEAAFSNPPGSVVKVKSEFGWHLIQVEEHGMAAKSITVDELGRRFGKDGTDDPLSVQLIDCRETSELELSSLPNFLNLPMGEYARWADQFENGKLSLEKDKETIVMCHHGIRSANFCSFLAQHGFTNVRNLIGGIDAYAKKIDNSVPQY